MSSIADALKRAQQERDRLRNGEAQTPRPSHTSHRTTVRGFRRRVPRLRRPPQDQCPRRAGFRKIPAPAPAPRPASATPLADAIRQAPPQNPPAANARQLAAETIVEDYASKTRLNLPAAMVVYHDRSGPIAQQYRKIRETLMAANPKRDPQMLVITSSVPGEGKTTTLVNLGLSLVEVRANRVLLIDGCLQPPANSPRRSLSDLLKLGAQPGLADLLNSPTDDAAPLIKATPWHNLYLLPAGIHTSSSTITDLLKSPALRQALCQVRNTFDWVLIDAPPALTVPHAGLFGASSDGILLVASLHHTPHPKIQTTARRLKSMNLPLKSCILTRA